MHPADVLQRIAFLLARQGAPHYKSRAFRRAAESIRALTEQELRERLEKGTLGDIQSVGSVTSGIIGEVLSGRSPDYLARLEGETSDVSRTPAGQLLAQLRGDCHAHSDWSDGKGTVEEMAVAARAIGHQYLVITDHSPRLTIAHGLSADRLREQLRVIDDLNGKLAPFRILSGIEVDILEDGSLDQEPDLLERLDLVVASVHSKLRMDAAAMTERMLAAIANPHMDVLGHCTGRIIVGKGRPESTFDADRVFAACAANGKAIEINSRPERLDPPRRLLRLAQELGCRFCINTDAHTPWQLEWQASGCERAVECGVGSGSVINAWEMEALLDWTSRHTNVADEM